MSFYSPQLPISVQWTKDFTPVDNFTGLDVKLYKENITINMDGIKVVHIGQITSLTVQERSTSVYSVVLKNELGEYSHQFHTKASKYS